MIKMFYPVSSVQSEKSAGSLSGDRTPVTQAEQEERRGPASATHLHYLTINSIA